MGKPYSEDLRKRVVRAVLTGGLSRNEAARQFGVAVSTAIGWVRRQNETGSVTPGKMGGHRTKAISGEHRVWVLERTKRDFTLRGLVAELAERVRDGRERPTAFWCELARKKTWSMGCCARESGDAVRRSRLGVITGEKLIKSHRFEIIEATG